MLRYGLALLGLWVGWCEARALNPELDMSQYAHTSWRVRDGFFTGGLQSIAQTPDGYLWLGTEFGLVRFDGVRATPWRPPAGQQLPGSQVVRLTVARDGTLWIGTDKGLASWKNPVLKIYPEVSEGITALMEDREGTIWVGTTNVPSAGKICSIRAGDVQCKGEGSLGPGVFGLYEDAKGTLWAAADEGIWSWKPGQPRFFPTADGRAVLGFAEDDQGALLVASTGGLRCLVDGRLTAYLLPGHSGPYSPSRILRDRDGGLWVATQDRGLLHFHHGRVDTFSRSDGLSGDDVLALFEDREGDVWAATTNGLDRFRDYAVPNFSLAQGLSSGGVYSALATRDGSVWAATSGGLSRGKDGRFKPFGPPSAGAQTAGRLDGSPPESLLQDSRGRIWVSTSREFGYLEGNRFVPVPNIPPGYIHDLVEAADGTLWIAHQQAGLLHLSQGKLIQQIPWTSLGHKDGAFVVAVDPSGKGLWLGFYGGGAAYLADGGIRRAYSVADGLGRGWVSDLRFDPAGVLWAATQGGLSRIQDGHILTLNSSNGLPCDTVHWSMEDNDHNVWLYMPCGLTRIAQSDLDAWAANPHLKLKVTSFDGSDGVPGHYPPNTYAQRVSKARDGTLWFGGLDALSVVDPHRLPVNNLPPPVSVEQIVADGKTYDAGSAAGNIRLPAHLRDLVIDYTALSLVQPDRVRFRYQLEGQDAAWHEVVNERRVQYSNLRPGTYRFRVAASNNSGVWNDAGAFIDFSIAPAYYQTAWFRFLCTIVFLSFLWALYQLRLHQLRRQYALGLEERVGERLRIARELHDTLLQSIQGAVFQFQAARNLLLRRADNAMQVLDEAIVSAENAIVEGRATIRDLRPDPAAQRDLPELLNAAGLELANAHQFEGDAPAFRVIVEGKPRPLSLILQDEIYRISREIIRNAFRHAGAGRIEIEVRYDADQLRLRIRDDGRGIDPKTLEAGGQAGHWGIPGMRERAQRIGAKLDFWSELGAGTEVQLIVPASAAYEKRQGEPRFRLFPRGR